MLFSHDQAGVMGFGEEDHKGKVSFSFSLSGIAQAIDMTYHC